jgi:septal ring factor EnvC (AmiA/AmiB activator)
VIDMGGSQYRFLGKLPLRKTDRWHLGIAATAIVAMILIGVINSSKNSNSSSVPPVGISAPSSQSAELSNLKARIESSRSSIAMLKQQLQPGLEEITSLDVRIETLTAELKSLDEQHKAGRQIDINGYNAKVKAHNALLSRRRFLMIANRNDLEAYDDLIKQNSVLIKQYNALLR